MKKITPKQEKFAQEYIKTGNATESAMATYNVESRKVAQSIGSENLSKPIIKERINTLSVQVREGIAHLLTQTNAIALALDNALKVIAHGSEGNCDREECSICDDVKHARKFISDLAKTITPSDNKPSDHKHLHLKFPKR